MTEDVMALNPYIKNISSDAFDNLRENKESERNYKLLTECTLVLVLVFNRKRIGQVHFLDIETYENNSDTTHQKELLCSLTKLEKNMCADFKRVVVFGKGSKPVAVLFTKFMHTYIDLLLEVRKTTNMVPKSNKYLFANIGSKDRWMS